MLSHHAVKRHSHSQSSSYGKWSVKCIGPQKWFLRMKNNRVKSGITFSFKWKRPNYSGARVLFFPFFFFFYFNVYFVIPRSVLHGSMKTLLHCLPKKSHIDIPHSTSVVAVHLPGPVALTWRRRWHEVPVEIRKNVFFDRSFRNVLLRRGQTSIIIWTVVRYIWGQKWDFCDAALHNLWNIKIRPESCPPLCRYHSGVTTAVAFGIGPPPISVEKQQRLWLAIMADP